MSIGNYFLNRTSIIQRIQARLGKWDCLKLENVCTSKETITRIKRLKTKWEKMSTSNSISDELISRTCNEIKNQVVKEQIIQLK
jgi:hypothetical protein